MPKPKPYKPFIIRRDGRVAGWIAYDHADGTMYFDSRTGGVRLTKAEVRRLAKWMEDKRCE